MDRAEALAKLRGMVSPFATMAAPTTAWTPPPSDVAAINRQAVDGILALIEQFAREPDVPVACLLDGEVGAGKSHVIGAICRKLGPEHGPYAFAEIKPLTNPRRPLRHLLQGVVTNLDRCPAGAELTQLDRITSRVLAKFLRRSYENDDQAERRARAFAQADQLERDPEQIRHIDAERWASLSGRVLSWLAKTPDIWSKAIKVFLQYIVPGKRRAVLDWLKGEVLDQPDLELLGLKLEPGEDEIDALEERAKRTLITLGHLLRYDRPLVICFDQLESLEDGDGDARLKAFAKLVFHLFNDVPGMMIVTSVRGEKWTAMRAKIDAAALQRIESSHFKLKPCDGAWARALIASRLRDVPRPPDAGPLFPFDQGPLARQLDETLAAGALSARLVLQKANRLWLSMSEAPAPAEDELDVLDAWVAAERTRMLAAPERQPPDEDLLTEALRLQFHALPEGAGFGGCTFLTPKVDKRYIDLVVQLKAPGALPRVAVLVDTEQNANAVAASFKHGTRALEGSHADRLVFVRDARVPFPPPPKWERTNALRGAFREGGGLEVLLELEQVAHWHAVVAAHNAIMSGDLTMLGAAGQGQTLGKVHFDRWIAKRGILPRFADLLAFCAAGAAPRVAERRAAAPPPAAPSRALTASLRTHAVRLLKECPAKLMTAGAVFRGLPADVRTSCGEAGALLGALRGFRGVEQHGAFRKPEDVVLGLRDF